MKFFTAVKLATYADAAFKAAGLNLEALAATGDSDAIKSALAAAGKSSPSAEAERAISEAVAENAELKAQLSKVSQELADAKTEVANTKANVAKQAAAIVAKAGHPAVAETITPAAVKPATEKVESNLRGRDRLAADFSQQARRIWEKEHGTGAN